MPTEVVMPALEISQDTGTLVHWLKSEGDLVQKGDPLMEIETDKVTVEIESPGTGVLANITAQPGDEVPVGQLIALLLAEGELPLESESPLEGEELSERETQSETRKVIPTSENSPARELSKVVATPVARRLAEENGIDLAEISDAIGADRIQKAHVLAYLESRTSMKDHRDDQEDPKHFTTASPKARRLASEHGLDMATLAGSGPDGAVLAGDVQEALAVRSKSTLASRALPTKSGEPRVIPVKGMRKVIADRLQESYQTAPHISLSLSADVTEILRISERLSSAVQEETGHPLTMTAILAKVVGATLCEHPRLNAHLVDDEIREFSDVHLGIAVALEDGLIVPVIRSVEQRGLSSIQSELNDLTSRARKGTIKLNEVKGGTFTISNLGMFGIEHFTAILNPPEVAILSIGTVTDVPVGVDGEVVLRPIMQVTINADHRAVDGAVAARFLAALKKALENPWLLLA